MFQNIGIFGSRKREDKREEQASLDLFSIDPVAIELPAGCEGQTVPSSRVLTTLLWQQYGLDLLHPEFSRWLDQNAPDVKHAVALNGRLDADCAGFKAGADRKIKVQISPVVDQRLREISAEYILWQLQFEQERFEPERLNQDAPPVSPSDSAESQDLAYAF